MSLEDNKKLVADFFACFGRKDIDGAMNMMTDDGTWWIGGTPELFSIAGTQSKAAMTELLKSLVPITKGGLEIIPSLMTAEEDRVAVKARSYAEFPKGFVYQNQYHFLVTVRDGKIASVEEFLDTMHTNELLKAEA